MVKAFVKIANKLSLGLLVMLVITIPMEISKTWFPVLLQDTKVAGQTVSLIDLSRIILFLLLLLWLLIIAIRGVIPSADYRFLTIPVLLFLILSISTVFVTSNQTAARNEILRLVFHVIIGLTILWTVKTIDGLNAIIHAFRLTMLLLSLIVLFQLITGKYLWNADLGISNRYNATIADPNILARYMVIGVFAWLFYKVPKGVSLKIVRYAGLLLALLTILLTQSRSSWLIFTCVAIGLSVIGPKDRRWQSRLMVLACGILGIIAFGLAPNLSSRLQTFQFGIGIVGARLGLMQAGVAMFLDHPTFGVGLSAFPIEYVMNYREYLTSYGELLNRSHTYIITTAAELGVIGLVVLASFIFQNYRVFLFTYGRCPNGILRQNVLIAFLGILIIFASSQSEGSFWEDPYLWVFWGALLASYRIRKTMAKTTAPPAKLVLDLPASEKNGRYSAT